MTVSRRPPRPVPVPGTTDSPVAPADVVAYTSPRDGLPPVTDSPEALQDAARALASGKGPVSIDAERASGFRYGQSAYLIQLRRAGSGTILIDPLATGDLDPLARALDGPEWILHAADQDLPCLADLGLVPSALFDTELAARLLGRDHVGLGAVTEETLGLRLAKDHAAADWSIRPLPVSWLIYAALDVELLADLREALSTELVAAGKSEWAAQEFEFERTRPPRSIHGGGHRGPAGRYGVDGRWPCSANCGSRARNWPPTWTARRPRSCRITR